MGWFVKFVFAVLLYLITKAIYTLKLHPLSKFPGPPLWILSRIPYLICMNRGRLPYRIRELHDAYGSIVRVSANELSFTDSRAWKDIYLRKDMLRPPQWGTRPPGVKTHNMISAPANDHARFRRALNPAYSEKRVYEYETVVRGYFDALVDRFDGLINEHGGKTAVVDIVEWANFATFDVIGELSWGRSYDCLKTGTRHAFMGVLLHFQAYLIAASIKYYPWLDSIMARLTPRSALLMLENILQDSEDRLKARLATTGSVDHPDLIKHLEDYNAKAAPFERLSEAEIQHNVLSIIIGGSETMTTTFSGAFHHLLAHPSKLAKVTKEVRSTFNSTSDIHGHSLLKLPYLNAVIDETLRLCPPIPDMLRRIVPKNTAVTIAGHVIPPGTTVSVSCYAMFRSASHFSDPDTFEPGRFLQQVDQTPTPNTRPDTNHHTNPGPHSPHTHNDLSVFHPFNIGPHGCLGQPLARLEMRLLLALFLYHFDVRDAERDGEGTEREGTERELGRLKLNLDWTDQRIYWTWEKRPLVVRIGRA